MVIDALSSFARQLPPPTLALFDQSSQQRAILPSPKRRVTLLWDLDNKPPLPRVQPFDVAVEVKKIAAEFGEVMDCVAYANKHAFTFVPAWVKKARERRQAMDQLEMQGLLQAADPYVCFVCRQKFLRNLDLKKHLLGLHEKERQRRVRLLKKLKNSPLKEIQALEAKEHLYLETARNLLIPKSGYGLDYELKRAGVCVRMVDDERQAADRALRRRMRQAAKRKLADCVFLIADDTDYEDVLVDVRSKGLQTVVLSETASLEKAVDVRLPWLDVMSGEARTLANEAAQEWMRQANASQEPSF